MTRRAGAEKVGLASGGTISGTVLDPMGKPAEGVIVLAGSLAAETGASGTYRLRGVAPGIRTLEAFGKDDLAARNDAVRVKTGETPEVSLRLARSATVTGTVIDEKSGRPLPGVRLSASAAGFSFSFRDGETISRRARTDVKGKFRIAGLAARRYSIKASKTDYLPATMPGVVAAVSAPGTVAIALQKAAGVAGRVTDEKGAPVAGARVRFVAEQGIRAILRGGPAALLGRPGVIVQAGPMQRLVFGEFDGTRSPRVEAFLAACLKGGINAEISPDIRREIWQKFVFLAGMSAVTASTRSSLGPVLSNPLTRQFFLDLMREAS